VRSNASEAAYSRGSLNNFERTYDCAKPIRSAGGRAGGYRGAAETAIIYGTGGLDDRLGQLFRRLQWCREVRAIP
jgi:hypothetical protein